MKRPFLHIFIFYSTGVIFFTRFEIKINLIKILLLLSMSLVIVRFIVKWNNVYIKYIILLSVFLSSLIIMDYKTQKHILPKFYDKKVKTVGVIKEMVSKEEKNEKYIMQIDKIKYKNKSYTIDEKLILSIYEDTDLQLGDKILTDIEIKEPNRNTNPKLFNYKVYLESKNIFSTGTTNQSNIKTLSKENLNFLECMSRNVKTKISISLDKSLNRENSNTIKSIILGDDSFLSKDYIDSFRKLGLSHILAVSGLHIGIIFGFIVYTLDLLKVHRKVSMPISIIIIWIYAGLIGFPPSVLRASLMFSFLVIGKLIHHRYDSLNILSFTGFLMLLYRPTWIFSVGFQLSFIATFTILFFLPYMKNIIKIKNKKLKMALSIILTAQIGVLPISVYYFNEFQTLSVLANLIIAPILTLGIIIGFLIVISSIVSVKLSMVIGILGNIVLNLSSLITNLLSKMTGVNIWLRSPSLLEIALYYFVLIILFKIIDLTKMNKRVQSCVYINLFIAFITSIFIQLGENTITLEFIDVGQGDACLVRLKDKNILIDTGGNVFGNFDVGKNILLPYLRKTGIKTIDGVFLSHFDADHVKGLLPLFEEIELKTIFIGYKSPENNLYKEIIKSAKNNKVTMNLINKGDVLKLNKSSYIEVLHPTQNVEIYDGENDKSLVFVLKTYNREILFTGDVEEKSEDYIINNSKKRNIDIIKVPHHGSKTSSKQEFIELFNPKVAIIQLGKNNFGHPNKNVLKRYYDNGTTVFRTDISGLIKVKVDEEKMYFEGYLKDKDKIFNYIVKNLYMVIYILYGGAIVLMMLEYREVKKDKL